MYIALSVILTAGILLALFIGLYRAKQKEIERLQTRLHEQEERNRLHNIEVYDNNQAEKKRRDLIEIYLVTNATPDDCEKIYAALIEQGQYGEFFYASTKKQRENVLRKLK